MQTDLAEKKKKRKKIFWLSKKTSHIWRRFSCRQGKSRITDHLIQYYLGVSGLKETSQHVQSKGPKAQGGGYAS
jgi:hypothetical protein